MGATPDDCPACDGTGEVPVRTCEACLGSGIAPAAPVRPVEPPCSCDQCQRAVRAWLEERIAELRAEWERGPMSAFKIGTFEVLKAERDALGGETT